MVARTRRTRDNRNRWSQIGISACVLLLPPIAIGAAAYAMLPLRDEVGGAPPAMPVAEVGKAVPALEAAAAPVQPPVAQPATQRQLPAPFSTGLGIGPHKDPARVGEPSIAPEREGAQTPLPLREAPPAAKTSSPTAAAVGNSDPQAFASAVEQPADSDLARVMGPVPVHVTVLVAPNAGRGKDERPANAETAVPPSAMLEDSAPELSPRMAGDPAGGKVGHSSRHLRKHFARHVVHRSASRSESRGEAKPRSFSLRNWLQQLGSQQRPAQQRS